jgi:hypothetical protein
MSQFSVVSYESSVVAGLSQAPFCPPCVFVVDVCPIGSRTRIAGRRCPLPSAFIRAIRGQIVFPIFSLTRPDHVRIVFGLFRSGQWSVHQSSVVSGHSHDARKKRLNHREHRAHREKPNGKVLSPSRSLSFLSLWPLCPLWFNLFLAAWRQTVWAAGAARAVCSVCSVVPIPFRGHWGSLVTGN